MCFDKRREFLFVYSVKDANPNGDPLNANHPRYDAETNTVMVSDVRIKRTIRDQWIKDGHKVFVDGEAKTLKSRISELKEELKVNTGIHNKLGRYTLHIENAWCDIQEFEQLYEAYKKQIILPKRYAHKYSTNTLESCLAARIMSGACYTTFHDAGSCLVRLLKKPPTVTTVVISVESEAMVLSSLSTI